MTKKEQNQKALFELWVQDHCLDALVKYSYYEEQEDEKRTAFYCGIWGAYRDVCIELGIPYPQFIEDEEQATA